MKNILLMILILPGMLKAEKIPANYNTWVYSEKPGKHAMQFGTPSNYWDGAKWSAIDSRFRSTGRGFTSFHNRHTVDIDTLTDIIRYSMMGRDGKTYVMRTRIGPLFFYFLDSEDTVCLAQANLSGYRVSNDTVTIRDVYPGVNCIIINCPDGLVQKFVFSVRADWMMYREWVKAGANRHVYTVNAFEIFVDSSIFGLRDANGSFNLSQIRKITGDIALSSDAGERLFIMPSGFLRQDTLGAPLWKKVVNMNGRSWLYEGFRNADIASWPRRGYSHCDSRTWSSPSQDTYISVTTPGTSYYSSAIIGAYRDATLGIRQRTLLWFGGLVDSLEKAGSIDSALLQIHYTGGYIGQGTVRLCRGIIDSIWYNTRCATWNARHKLGNDSLSWAGGWGVHTSSYTETNAAVCNLADTNSAGWYRFSCKELIEDIRANGIDYGFWLDNGSETNSQRAYFDSAEDAGGDYPRLYIEYSDAENPPENSLRRRKEE